METRTNGGPQPVGNPAEASCSDYVVPGKIGRVDLSAGYYSFGACLTLMAEDIARTRRVSAVLLALKYGQTVRGLMKRMYGVTAPAPSISDWTNDKIEAKVLRLRMRYFTRCVP